MIFGYSWTMADATAGVEEALHRAIRGAGLRLTLPRRAICRVLAKNGEGFITAADLIGQIEAQSLSIDSSTVYRTLDELARIGLVHHVHLGSQPGRWHLTIDHDHQHLVCEGCGRTILVPAAEVEPMFERFRTEYGFTINTHHFAILGFCDECRARTDHPHN